MTFLRSLRTLSIALLGCLAPCVLRAEPALSVPPETPRADAQDTANAQPDANTGLKPAEGLSTGVGRGSGLRISTPEVNHDLGNTSNRIMTLDLTHDANDIWDRMRRGFSMPDLDSDLVTKAQIYYLSRPGFLKQVLERGRRYMYYFLSQIEERGLPAELALLPMVESSYNPMAYSRAHASGLWQFIPSTGRNYNLTQDHWVDERRDVIASTTAALDYLENVYQMQGDWHLALASYNWGEAAVARAVQRNQTAGLPTDYMDLQMPEETRNYVPKLQALKNIIAQPELFNITLPYVPNRPYFVQVDAPDGMDLATAAKMAEVPLDEFIALNPGFNRPVIGGEARQLVIPVDKEDIFRANLAAHGSDTLWRTYHVQPGERIEQIAGRYGLTTSQLKQINGISPRSHTVPGQALLVPSGGDVDAALAATRWLPAPAAPAATSSKKTARSSKASKRTSKAHSTSKAKAGTTSKSSKSSAKSTAKPASKSSSKSAKPASRTSTTAKSSSKPKPKH